MTGLVLLLTLGGCQPQAVESSAPVSPDGVNTAEADASSVGPATDPPAVIDEETRLESELALAKQTLQTRQEERLQLLVRKRTELEELTADLRIRLSDAGLTPDAAAQKFADPKSERDPQYAELVSLYRKAARTKAFTARLEKVRAEDQGTITQLEAALDELEQKRQFNEAFSQADRDAARRVLDRATLNAEESDREDAQNPELLTELNTAFDELKDSLQKRISLLPKRPETKLEDLPPLPKLDFMTDGLAEKVLLETLQDVLAEGTKQAQVALQKQQPETAIAALQRCFQNIRRELAGFSKPPAWKTDCEQSLEAAATALSEQMAAPYVTALETAIPEARRQKDWAPVLSLLEELIRVAPQAKQLPGLMDTLQTLLVWRVEVGDLEARVAAERFNQLQDQLRRPKIDLGINAPARPVKPGAKPGSTAVVTSPGGSGTMLGPVDMTAWKQVHATLVRAAHEHEAIRAELLREQNKRRDMLATKFETSTEVRAQDNVIAQVQTRLAQQLEVVRQRLADRDRADKVVFDGLARHIADLENSYHTLTDPNGIGERPESDKAKAEWAKVDRAKQWQAPFQPGADRATGKGTAVDIARVVGHLALEGLTAGELKIIRVKNQELRFHWCPAGTFRMGSPAGEQGRDDDENQVTVTLSQGFWMLETEVTQGLWTAVMGGSLDWSDKGQSATHPVYNVSHTEAVEFCEKLTALVRASGELPADWSITLPTEAQWEYAARAETTTRYYWGDRDEDADEYAWHSGNSGSTTHPVGQKKPNVWGLHDMSGNVWEWCADWYVDKLAGGTDPRGPSSASYRVLRGGSWGDSVGNGYLRSAGRFRYSPGFRYDYLGFRVACSSVKG